MSNLYISYHVNGKINYANYIVIPYKTPLDKITPEDIYKFEIAVVEHLKQDPVFEEVRQHHIAIMGWHRVE